jgi:hypothetical protein
MQTGQLRNTLIAAGVLVVVDAFLLNQGFISILVFVACIVRVIVLALQSLVRRLQHRTGEWKLTLQKVAVTAAAAVLVIGFINLSNVMAESRAERIAAACAIYKHKYQHYPQNLSQLVPEFLPSIPAAKYVLNPAWSGFMYIEGERPSILYYAIPPFGRRIYHVESKTWTYLD